MGLNSQNPPDCDSNRIVKINLKTPRQVELFRAIQKSLGMGNSDTLIYVLTNYAERMNLISEELHNRKG